MTSYIDEYQRNAITTAKNNAPEDLLVECAMGLASETGEIAAALLGTGNPLARVDEIGDVLWYTAVAAEALGHDSSDILGAHTWDRLTAKSLNHFVDHRVMRGDPPHVVALQSLMHLVAAQGVITNHMKKVVFHRHKREDDLLRRGLIDVYCAIALLVHSLNMDLETIATYNNEKLMRRRYPNGYSHQASRERTV